MAAVSDLALDGKQLGNALHVGAHVLQILHLFGQNANRPGDQIGVVDNQVDRTDGDRTALVEMEAATSSIR